MVDSFLEQYLDALLAQVLDPAKRIHLAYLATALVIAIAWLMWVKRVSFIRALRAGFDRRVFLGASGRADLRVFLINQAIMLALSPLLLGRLVVAGAVYLFLADALHNPGGLLIWPQWLVAALFTVSYFLLDDASRYGLHRLLHEWPMLWAFHKVHHSARTLSPLTVYRTHPVESILFALRGAIVQGGVTAVFVFVFGTQVNLLTVLGASVVVFAFNVTGANLRHSHIHLRYWSGLEHVFISPFQHQLHHSSAPQHFNRNYGAMLAIWDWLGGTLVISKGQARPRFGLSRRPDAREQSLFGLYLLPFMDSLSVLRRRLSTWLSRARGAISVFVKPLLPARWANRNES